MKFNNRIILTFFNFITIVGFAQTDGSIPAVVELNGYIKNVNNTYFSSKMDTNTNINLIHNRLNFKFNISKKITGKLEIRNRIFYGEQVKMIPYFGSIINQYNGYFNLSHIWFNKDLVVAQSVIDRLLIQYTDEKWDVKVGRQRINWGIHNIWNPNDIFNAYNFLDFDYEERSGNDAVRINRNLTTNSNLEIAYKPSKRKNETTAAFLYRTNKWNYDFQFVMGIYQSEYVVGGGWAGNLKQTGFKGEMSLFIPQKNNLLTSKSFSFSLMVDQTFKNNWYVSLSSLFNTSPSNLFDEKNTFYNSNLSAKLLFPFRYNFHLSTIKTLSPISSLAFSSIYSPNKNAMILIPSYSRNLNSNFDLDFTIQSLFLNQNQLYKNIGNTLYIRFRWSF